MIRFGDATFAPSVRPARALMRRTVLFALLIGCALRPAVARAQNPLASCKNQVIEKERFEYPLIPGSENAHEGVLSGRVKVVCDGMLLQAQEIRWRDDSDMVYASGDVYFEQQGTQISAERAQMNRQTHLGTFFQASGWMVLQNEKPSRSLFGSQEPYIIFWADEIEKTDPDRYVLRRGGFTSCRQPTPRWDMAATRLTLVPGEHAILRNMVLRVKDVPLFYLPGLYYPINKSDRATGVLLPIYGSSTIKGMALSNAFFWAIDRSRDATFYHDLFTKTGQGVGGEYRYVGENGSGQGRIYMLDEHEQFADDKVTVLRPAHRSYDITGSINQGFGGSTRVTGHVNYFTDISTQQLYQQNIYNLSLRTRSFGGMVSGGTQRYRLSGQYEQTDVFYGTAASRVGTAPYGNFTFADSPIGRSPVYFGAALAGGYLVRQDDIEKPETDRSLWRIDGGPHISAPLSNLLFLTATASAAWRFTYWSESLDPALGQVAVPVTRQLLDLNAKVVGPVFSRIYRTPQNGYAEGFKHLIEPSMTVGWLSNFTGSDQLVQLDPVDAVVAGTTTYTYGLANRLLAKRRGGVPVGQPVPPGTIREILTVDVRQTYYTDARAAQYDAQYQTSFGGLIAYPTPPSPFSPVQITALGRLSDTTSAQFRMEYDMRYKATRTFSASGTIDEPYADITGGWSKRQVIPGLTGFEDPSSADHYLNLNATIKHPDNKVGGTFAFNYDVLRGYFLQRRYRVFYNSQCCGLAFDLQTVDLTHFSNLAFAQSDRRMSVSFTLAGIGTFSNPLGAFSGGTGSR